jgi:hypothetical protein
VEADGVSEAFEGVLRCLLPHVPHYC